MGKISVYTPQIQIPVVSAPQQGVDRSGLNLASAADRIYSAWDQRQQDDARVNVALERIKAQRAFTDKFQKDYAEGLVNDAYPGEFQDSINEYYAPVMEAHAGNKYFTEAMLIAQQQDMAEFGERTMRAAADAARTRRLMGAQQVTDNAIALVVQDPTKGKQAYTMMKQGLSGITHPDDVPKVRAMEQGAAANYFSALLNDKQAGRVIDEVKNNSTIFAQSLSANDRLQLLQMADNKQKEIWNQNYNAWEAKFAVERAQGRKVGLPDVKDVGPDRYNDALVKLNPAPTAESTRLQDAVDEILYNGRRINSGDPDQVKVGDAAYDKALENQMGQALDTDADGNFVGTPEKIAAVRKQAIYDTAYISANQFGLVPSKVTRLMQMDMDAKSQGDTIKSLAIYDNLKGSNDKSLYGQLPKEVQNFYGEVAHLRNEGTPVADAIEQVRRARGDKLNLGQSTIEGLERSFNQLNDGAVKTGIGSERISLIDDYVNRKMRGAAGIEIYKTKMRERAMENFVADRAAGHNTSIETIIENTWRQASASWTVSIINSPLRTSRDIVQNPFSAKESWTQYADDSGAVMTDPPEIVYGIYSDQVGEGPTDEARVQNALWIRAQALESVRQVVKKGAPTKFEDGVQIIINPGNHKNPANGKPTYNLKYKGSDGDWHVLSDANGRPLVWAPDPAKSKEALRMTSEVATRTEALKAAAAAKRADEEARKRLKGPSGIYR